MPKINIVIVKNSLPELDLMTAYILEIFEQHVEAGVTVIGFIDPKKSIGMHYAEWLQYSFFRY